MGATHGALLLAGVLPLLACASSARMPPDYKGDVVEVGTYTVRVPPPPRTWPMRPPPWGVASDPERREVTFTGSRRVVVVSELSVPPALLDAPDAEVVAACLGRQAEQLRPLAPPTHRTDRYRSAFDATVPVRLGGTSCWRVRYEIAAVVDWGHVASDVIDDAAAAILPLLPGAPADTIESGYLVVVLRDGWRERRALHVVRLVPQFGDAGATRAMMPELWRDVGYVIATLVPAPAPEFVPRTPAAGEPEPSAVIRVFREACHSEERSDEESGRG